MQRTDTRRLNEPLILILLATVCYVFFFNGLGNIGLLGPDEPRYASVAREMYQSGDFVTPRLHGMVWFEKPVLLYWAAAVSFAVFGVSEFAVRLPSAVAASVGVFFIYFVCRRLWGQGVGMAASVILASCVGYLAFARAASMDMLLAVCLTLALLSFLMGYNTSDPERKRWFAAFYAFIGLGVLAKGPIAILLPVLSLAGYLLLRGRRGEWREWRPLYAVIIFLIAAPWFVAVIRSNGFEFVRVFFINHNVERFTSTMHGHERPFYFYLPDLLLLTFPWSFTLIPALRRTLDRNDRILLWFAVVPIVFFSFSGSKLPGYILPSVPPIAILCARAISGMSTRAFRIAVFIEAGAMLFIGIAFGFFGEMLNVDAHISGLKILLMTSTMAAMLVLIAIWLKPLSLFGFNAIAMTIVVLIATSFVLPDFETTDTARPWRSVLASMIPDEQTVYLYKPARWMEYGIQFYRFNKMQGVWSPAEFDTVLQKEPRALFVSDDKGLAELGKVDGIEIKIMKTVGTQTVFWASLAR
jgi:4-amino-4-deoxy-L-arabinose transferase-like glycosyltransferase